ncbi:hypothetical protein GCM10023194_49280 [Planotetraspora phitsanulokensis]|uniref:Tetratricopeptide repeat protein n=1 Tax=Planotetraspora phitsanulokensis TaxID=575192 RepID=A0A8J3XHX0_9ACTN|nr:hypothetical protein [Planotetraspora phitsanulokensis]GII36993.1 hypothetical protein Pph01_19960 [Planotetraspora phitsanulokensis]
MTPASEGTGDRRMEAEGELSMARLALDDGERQHAAEHIANALVCDPTFPDAHELLTVLTGRSADRLDLFPVEQPAFLGAVVARAHVLAADGEHSEALDLLVSAQCHQPAGRWADVPWVLDTALATRVPPDELCALAARLLRVLPDPVPSDMRPGVQPYLSLVRNSAGLWPQHAGILWVASVLSRRMELWDEALDMALRSENAAPSLQASVAVAYAYRSLKRWAESERAFLRALEHDPGNAAVETDIAELLATSGRPADGLAWVERVLKREPHQENAFPTACGMRFARDGDVRHLVELADHLREHPDNAHAEGVLTSWSQRRFWLGPVPAPSESVVNVLSQVLEAEEKPSGGTLTVSAPEPPSALLAFDHSLPDFTLTIGGVPDPDPRSPVPEVFASGPVRSVGRRVWDYDATDARPSAAPPSPDAARALQDIAQQGWPHLLAAYDQAVRLSGLALDDLLGVLVHPPAPPEGDTAGWPEWIRSVQAWACLGIAHHRADQPWAGSDRREVLIDLAYGPEDWVTEAALLGLVTTAWVAPDTRADVAEVVGWRFIAAMEASRTRPVTILESLALLTLATPDMNPDVSALASRVLTPGDDGEDETPRATGEIKPRWWRRVVPRRRRGGA